MTEQSNRCRIKLVFCEWFSPYSLVETCASTVLWNVVCKDRRGEWQLECLEWIQFLSDILMKEMKEKKQVSSWWTGKSSCCILMKKSTSWCALHTPLHGTEGCLRAAACFRYLGNTFLFPCEMQGGHAAVSSFTSPAAISNTSALLPSQHFRSRVNVFGGE